MVPDEDILKRVVQAMAHMEDAGYIGRRHGYHVGRFPVSLRGLEKSILEPELIDTILEILGSYAFSSTCPSMGDSSPGREYRRYYQKYRGEATIREVM
jgi:hypothetical protein